MSAQRDPAILLAFVDEARGYLPGIRDGVVRYLADESLSSEIQSAYRLAHTIAGAASMVGLDELSAFARGTENVLEEYALVGGALAHERGAEVLAQLDEIEQRLAVIADVAASSLPADQAEPAAPSIHDAFSFEDAPPSFDDARAAALDEDLGGAEPLSFGNEGLEEGAADEDIDPEMLEIFRLEAEEHLRTISASLVVLDRTPGDRPTLKDIRRSAHTLKGAAAVVGFQSVTKLAHRMEDLLDALYDNEQPATPALTSLLLAATEQLEQLVGGTPPSELAHSLETTYHQFDSVLPVVQAGGTVEVIEGLATAARHEAAAPTVAAPVEAVAKADAVSPVEASAEVRAESAEAEERRTAVARIAAAQRHVAPDAREQQAETEPGEAEALPATSAASEAAMADAAAAAGARQFVRVPLAKLDSVSKLMGELVISRTALEQRVAQLEQQVVELHHSTGRLRRASGQIESEYETTALLRGPVYAAAGAEARVAGSTALTTPAPTGGGHGFDDLEFDRYTEFHRLTREMAEATSDSLAVRTELENLLGDFDSLLNRQRRLANDVQESVMRMRMVPLRTLATRLHRTVRVTADRQGKQAELILEGDTLELDSQVLDSMSEPLLHMLRNSVGHGLETPEVRRSHRKPARGRVWLSAYHEGTQAVLRVRDDGRGLDADQLRKKAVSGGFISSDRAAALSDADVMSLVFIQGLSTAEKVTDVSGRGVGMDIVRDTVQKLRGTITIDSTPNEGTSFTIRLPLTLAVIRALVVKVHGQPFAIPLAALQQILRLGAEDSAKVLRDRVVSMNNKLLPVVRLSEALEISEGPDVPTRLPVLIVRVGESEVALVVDDIVEGREVVIKSLGRHLQRVRGIMGATIFGDGSVVPILNVVDLLGKHEAEAVTTHVPVAAAPARKQRDTLTVLIVDDSPSVRRVMTNLIKGASWTPLTAKDGLDALEMLRNATALPDVVLTDIEMPRMDGYELLAALKANEVLARLPVAMITSRAGEKHRRKALDNGAADYLTKPYSDEQLLSMVRRMSDDSGA
jgi:chemosensory pili system protein ChpA (sensor histidine kinase/response regulator)